MAERQIEELINELRTLKLRVETLEAGNNNGSVRTESTDHTRSNDAERVNGIGVGDRVRIINE
jgi:molybdopterin-guanine dinucleotide biosynthesis protein